ncbi:hypothetical protein LF824_06210 [Citrobacter freundii]|uniref:hypothetical protein n=1 Tax=Citrobacter TaxID=544 RepID=UPI0018FF44E4|nr:MULTISPECIES: hypothetical protein [Citrobacter]MBJ9153435.1 hypothetical protein [Citrobacter freundii]MBJ9267252.1 hypothetical protein [Citrobacter freundii]MCO5619067.1 hypothetical protein [Citrobacter freundii]MCO5628320.1 hypothetical protein [Citrobacter freundii]MCO5633097.1 hypothetical protein [Citrobacter freundii]
MQEPRCIAQLLRKESPQPMAFNITHGKGCKGIIIRTRKPGFFAMTKRFIKSIGVSL